MSKQILPSIENSLNNIIKDLNTSHLKLNNLYKGTYIYTLNSYKDMLIRKSEHLGIDNTTITNHLLNLMKTEYFPELGEQCKKIASIPIIEQKTPEWFKQRETMISASDSGYFLNKCGMSKAIDSLKIKVGLKSYVSSNAPPLMHGNTYEDVARAIYESRNGVSVTEYGILSSPTPCVGASPDGIITMCHNDTYESQSKFGRLLEIKNPFSRIIDDTIKPEYMVQILQQQYTTQLPICDFVETTIVDVNCNTNNSNYKPYTNLTEMLNDKLDKTNPLWQNRIKNKNIPVDNLNKFGNEKGLVITYQKRISSTDIRLKYILYPLSSPYDSTTIEKWVIDTNSEQWNNGFQYSNTKYWRLDVYCEKTVIYDQNTFENDYVPKLCKVWDIITKCNSMKPNTEKISSYIDEIELDEKSVFYNERKRKKNEKNEKNELKIQSIKNNKPENDIILDF